MKNQSTKNIKQKVQDKDYQLQQVQELLFGPELEILNKRPNAFLDRLLLEIELRDGKSKISDVIMTEPRVYEAIFHKVWFYRLADMLGVSRSVMDTYVKAKYVREFFIKFVYARLSYKIFRELKSARKLAKAHDAKLFQFLKGEYYKLIKNKLPVQQTLSF
jgi:hypothetical protein